MIWRGRRKSRLSREKWRRDLNTWSIRRSRYREIMRYRWRSKGRRDKNSLIGRGNRLKT